MVLNQIHTFNIGFFAPKIGFSHQEQWSQNWFTFFQTWFVFCAFWCPEAPMTPAPEHRRTTTWRGVYVRRGGARDEEMRGGAPCTVIDDANSPTSLSLSLSVFLFLSITLPLPAPLPVSVSVGNRITAHDTVYMWGK